jgi:hypothetical protein
MKRETLIDTAKYKNVLEADMATRDAAQLQHILEIMAESRGGQAILFADMHTPDAGDKLPDPDPELAAALDKRCGELGTTRDAMLAAVKAKVITPFEGQGESGQVMRDLVGLGHRVK